MIKLERIPKGLDEILAVYGRPFDDEGELDPGWYARETAVFTLPVTLRLSWNPAQHVTRFRAHRLVGEAMKDAIMSIAAFYGPDFHGLGLDEFGGCFNFRHMRGGHNLSTHAWGIAIDYLPELGKLGSTEDAQNYPQHVREAFEERGFVWGGNWARPDAMHFQAAAGY